jgi:hypothetical protein
LTLFSVRLILQSKCPQSLPRRRENVPRQLALWSEAERPPQKLTVWEELDPNTQNMIIAILSRLISKAVYPKTQEDNHER